MVYKISNNTIYTLSRLCWATFILENYKYNTPSDLWFKNLPFFCILFAGHVCVCFTRLETGDLTIHLIEFKNVGLQNSGFLIFKVCVQFDIIAMHTKN